MMRPVLLALILSFTFLSAVAYDFSALNDDGLPIFYNISGEEAQVTFCKRFVPTDSYTSHLKVPATVTYGGTTYTVTSVGRHAFYGTPVESIGLPETLTSIDDFAFAGCSLLSSIELPVNTSSLGTNIFDGCFSLSEIKVASGNTSFRSISGALYDKSGSSLLIYPQGRENEAQINPNLSEISDRAFYGCPYLSHISIPEGVKSIGENAFYFCNGITSINIPASVSAIGRTAFANCFNLSTIEVDESNSRYISVDGILLEKNGGNLLASPASRVGSASIPESVTRISDFSFFRNIGITTAILPEGTEEIGDGAFIDCQSLTAISLPSSLKRVGTLAFAMCGSLEAVYVRNAVPSDITISADTFSGIDTRKCILYVPAGSAGEYSAMAPWNEFQIIIEFDALKPQEIVWTVEYNLDSHESITINLDAEASSGLPVTYTLAPESIPLATLAGNQLTMSPNTKVTVTATQNGNYAYAPAEALTRTIEMTDAIDTPVSDSNIRVIGSQGKIIVSGVSQGTTVRVYDVSGRTIFSGTDHVIDVASGQIYIVNVEKETFKVPVR